VNLGNEGGLLGCLSRGVVLRVVGLRPPVSLGLRVHQVVDNFSLLHPAVRVQEVRLVEGLVLIVSVAVLRSDDVGVLIILSLPRGLVEELGVGLEPTGNCALAVAFLHSVVKLDLSDWHLNMSVWLRSIVRLQVRLAEGRAPLFIESGMRLKHGSFSISSEEGGSGLVELLLISHEVNALEPIVGLLEAVLLDEAPAGDLREGPAQFRVALGAWDESCVLGDRIRLQRYWFLVAHIVVTSSVHVAVGPSVLAGLESVEVGFVHRRASPVPLRFLHHFCFVLHLL